MLQPERTRSNIQLLEFQLPGLPDTHWALSLQEVLAVTSLPDSVPVPMAPSCIYGLSVWRTQPVTVLDMVGIVKIDGYNGHNPPGNLPYLVAQASINNQIELIAWPIVNPARAIRVPAQVPQTDLSATITSTMMRAAISVGDRSLLLLDIGGLHDVVSGFGIQA